MRNLMCALLLTACALSLAAAKEGAPAGGQAQFTSSEAAYNAGKADGYRDGIAAGGKAITKSAGKESKPGGTEACEIPQIAQYSPAPYAPSPSYSSDYDRGYHDGYEAGYRRGYDDAKAHYEGWGAGFAWGFFLGLIGVIVSAVMN